MRHDKHNVPSLLVTFTIRTTQVILVLFHFLYSSIISFYRIFSITARSMAHRVDELTPYRSVNIEVAEQPNRFSYHLHNMVSYINESNFQLQLFLVFRNNMACLYSIQTSFIKWHPSLILAANPANTNEIALQLH